MIPPVANRFVAGESGQDALEHVDALNDRSIAGTINRLGTNHDGMETVDTVTAAYQSILVATDDRDLEASVSVKPSQLGLAIDRRTFETRLEAIVDTATDCDGFVWLDMEAHDSTDVTIEAFETLAPAYPARIGLCLQANLRRTRADLARVADLPGAIRLVKGGAYAEPEAVAYMDRSKMDERYRSLIERAFDTVSGEIAIATHDETIIDHARALEDEHDRSFEVQMLMGVRTNFLSRLAAERSVAQYVPYGQTWKKWALNRVRENPRSLEVLLPNSVHALRARS